MTALPAEIESAVAFAVRVVGGPIKAASICGVSRQAVDKWIARGAMPRTEYTGESNHCEALAGASAGAFEASWLKDRASPSKSAA